ncbi:MAG: hypothetical protein AAGC85_16955, partial [Bacteroidota bacterium]
VRRIDDQVRVTASLINTSNRKQVWAENFDRELTGIFEIQSEIAKNIASTLNVELSEEDEEKISPFGTDNLEAYEIFLETVATDHETPKGLLDQIEGLKKVIKLDSTFARAYAYLGERYALLSSWWGNNAISEEEAYKQAKRAFEKAIELNPYEESTYRKMASINMQIEWDFESAEKNIQKSERLAPNYMGVWDYYQWIYTIVGRYEESVYFGRKVVNTRRGYKWGLTNYGLTLYLNGQVSQSEKELDSLLIAFPTYISGIWRRAQVHLAEGESEKAITLLNSKMRALELRPSPLLATLGASYARQGNWVKAEDIVKELQQKQNDGEHGLSFFIAMIYAGGRNTDETFHWLEKSYQSRDWELVWLKSYPVFHYLKSDSAYRQLLRKINID